MCNNFISNGSCRTSYGYQWNWKYSKSSTCQWACPFQSYACRFEPQSQNSENIKGRKSQRAPKGPPYEGPPKSGLRVSVCILFPSPHEAAVWPSRPLPKTSVLSIRMSSSPKVLDLDMVASDMKKPYHDQGGSLVWMGPWAGPLAVLKKVGFPPHFLRTLMFSLFGLWGWERVCPLQDRKTQQPSK